MKFSNGFWLQKKGFTTSYAAQAYEIGLGDREIDILATHSPIYNRGMTLGGPNLEVTLSAHTENIIRVTIRHFTGAKDASPKFELNEDSLFYPALEETDDHVSIASGKLKAVVSKGNRWKIDYFYDGRRITGVSDRTTSYITDDRPESFERAAPEFFDSRSSGKAYLREQLSLDVGECVYGFGERFTPFVKNGQSVETWNSDGGTCTDQSYKSIPFYMTSSGYGVFVNSTGNVSYEVASDTVSRVSFTLPGETLEYFIIGGDAPLDVLSNYTALTGRPPLVPEKSFGLWLSTSFTTSYDEKTITSFIDGMAERDIPLQTFHFDCFWMREFQWCDFEFDRRQFPEPSEMLGRLRGKGLGVCVWINPYIGQRSKLFAVGRDKGYFLKNRDGGVFQTDLWQPGMAIVDFTNPEACEWYTGFLRRLFDMGVTNLKTDFGERIPTDAVYYNGADPVMMHNYYTYLYNKVVYNALTDYYGESQGCLFSRSATVGSQKFPVHWGGDCSAEYVSMAETLRGGLSLCMSGFGYFSHDIGGFESTATPDLYKRWTAFGLMSSHSRLHGSSTYRVPWNFDDEACDVLRFFTKLKGRLMPYLWSEAQKTASLGYPIMRAMALEFPRDKVCRYLDAQYMFGGSLLCAPIFNDRGQASFWLPDGKWTDVITGECCDGGRYIEKTCSYFEIPLLARENSIIAFGAFENDFEYDYLNGTEFVIYNLAEGRSASAEIFDASGSLVFTLRAANTGGKLSIETDDRAKYVKVTDFAAKKTIELRDICGFSGYLN